ncbi:MAG: hypothetical protein KatS3mg114_1464 [Planctomycetaceae bacterium]|nr:MAG: hypothetical protein KatS3mg114_1464 [Planctomycetaceae bacterium]
MELGQTALEVERRRAGVGHLMESAPITALDFLPLTALIEPQACLPRHHADIIKFDQQAVHTPLCRPREAPDSLHKGDGRSAPDR